MYHAIWYTCDVSPYLATVSPANHVQGPDITSNVRYHEANQLRPSMFDNQAAMHRESMLWRVILYDQFNINISAESITTLPHSTFNTIPLV